MSDSITTLDHYLIRQVQCLGKAEYEIVRNSILKNLLAYGTMTCAQLRDRVKDHLKHKFADSLYQYYETVREVLETRGEIRCVPRTYPQLIEIVE